MPQFALILCLALVLSLSNETSTASKLRQVLRITWSLSSAICAQRASFELEKKTQPTLREASITASKQNQLCSYITSNTCEFKECKRFKCDTNKGISFEGAKPLGQQTPSTQTHPDPISPNIIVRMKRQQKCEAKPLPCNGDIGCVPSSNRASHLRTIVDSLKTHATKTQGSVLPILQSSSLKSAPKSSIKIQPLWSADWVVKV